MLTHKKKIKYIFKIFYFISFVWTSNVKIISTFHKDIFQTTCKLNTRKLIKLKKKTSNPITYVVRVVYIHVSDGPNYLQFNFSHLLPINHFPQIITNLHSFHTPSSKRQSYSFPINFDDAHPVDNCGCIA